MCVGGGGQLITVECSESSENVNTVHCPYWQTGIVTTGIFSYTSGTEGHAVRLRFDKCICLKFFTCINICKHIHTYIYKYIDIWMAKLYRECWLLFFRTLGFPTFVLPLLPDTKKQLVFIFFAVLTDLSHHNFLLSGVVLWKSERFSLGRL